MHKTGYVKQLQGLNGWGSWKSRPTTVQLEAMDECKSEVSGKISVGVGFTFAWIGGSEEARLLIPVWEAGKDWEFKIEPEFNHEWGGGVGFRAEVFGEGEVKASYAIEPGARPIIVHTRSLKWRCWYEVVGLRF